MDFNQAMRQLPHGNSATHPVKENAPTAGTVEATKEIQFTSGSLAVAQKIGNSAQVIQIPAVRYGAMPADWDHLDLILGLGADLLPVVSTPDATISPDSSMKQQGKVPSRYNARHQVAGFTQWPSYQATPDDITSWAKEKDYGICLQMRQVRAIDVDVEDLQQAERIRQFIGARYTLPVRTRSNSSKFLMLFDCPGEIFKRKFKTEHGIVELLAQGQQAIVAGTHPSGARYEWAGGLPDSIPALSMAQFEQLWRELGEQFAVEVPTESKASTKAQTLADAASADPVAQYLLEQGRVSRTERDGRLHIECPWSDEHSPESGGESSTTYWPAHTGGYEKGGFKCLHAHCEQRTVEDLKAAIGYRDPDDFEAITDDDATPIIDDQGKAPAANKFPCVPAHVFAAGSFPEWIVEDVLPEAELAMVYGPSGSGKSFFIFDLAASVARGVPWRGHDVKQGRVIYVAAEGANGARMRLKAYAHQHQIDLADMPFDIIPAAPNFLIRADAAEVAKSVGKAAIIIVDTFAATMLGNENSGDDVGNALKNLKDIHKHTGALVTIIHHSGKDEAKGARGWSGMRAAMDAEIETARVGDARAATVTKMKDGEEGAEYGFRLHTVVVGIRPNGKEVTSCIVEHVGGVLASVRQPVGDVQRKVIQAAREHIPPGGVIPVNDLVELAIARLENRNQNRDKRREHVQRAIEKLIESAFLCKLGGDIALPHAPNAPQ